MNWSASGPKLCDLDIAEFEKAAGRPLPGQVRWFLTEIVNGGGPKDRDLWIPIGDPRDPEADVLYLFAINAPKNGSDLLKSLTYYTAPMFQSGWPIGYDSYNCTYLFYEKGPYAGQVRYMPHQESQGLGPGKSFAVAGSMAEFAALIRKHGGPFHLVP